MKKFLSVLLAVMMVLSTVSFAAPSVAGTFETSVEAPVLDEEAYAAAAELAADDVTDEFGTLLAEVNFDVLATGEYDFVQPLISALGGSVESASSASVSNVKLTNGSGASYPCHGTVVKEREPGNKYLELTTAATANYNLLQLWTGKSGEFFTDKEGYLTLTFDVLYSDEAATSPFNVAFNRSQQAEGSDQGEIFLHGVDGNWGKVIATYDEELGVAGIGGNSATMTSVTMVNYVKIHCGSDATPGEKYGIDNIRLYWRPKTADVTIDIENGDDIVLNDYDTIGTPIGTLAAMLPAVDGKTFVGFSLTKDGELLKTTKFPGECTIYPVYEERVNLPGSLEFTTEAEFKKVTFRQSASCVAGNALGTANTLSHDATNGYLKATFQSTDPTKCVQDPGINLSGINIPAGVLTNIEIKVRFTGMPTTTTTLNNFTGGTKTYTPASVNFPQYYFTTGGVFSTKGESLVNDFTNANDNWMVINYTPEELGISDLTTFRFDFYDLMPHGSTLEIDYIRFIGKPVRVTVDNGANETAPEVVMDITGSTLVSEVAAKYEKDHGDMKFLGLARTPGGAVLAGTEPVSATGEPTTLYAIWDDYEYLTNYSVEFNNEIEESNKVRIQQNNAQTSYEWNKNGYLTLKSVPIEGFEATWDQQVYVETIKPDTALVPGVVSEIAVRMRYRNVPTEKKSYTVSGRTTTELNPDKAPSFIHIAKATATKWGEQLQQNNAWLDLEESQWFVRYYDAETYFKEGLAYARFDTIYPMPAGVEVDIDYIRFIGDNQDDRIPGIDYTGDFGERIFTVDFDDAATGTLESGKNVYECGAEVNGWLSAASNGITFAHGSNHSSNPEVAIAEKSSDDKYLTYTVTNNANTCHFFFSACPKKFTNKDGYYIITYDYKSEREFPFTFRMNRNNEIEDTSDHHIEFDKGDGWKTAVVFYDAEIGNSVRDGKVSIASTREIDIVKWHPSTAVRTGETVSMDNFTLWFVPKTVSVTVDLSAYGLDNVVIKDYPTTGLSNGALENLLPTVPNNEIAGLSLELGGEPIYQNRIASDATLYPVYEKVNILEGSYEFNSSADLARIFDAAAQARLGKNNAKTTVAQQFVLESDKDGSYLHIEAEAADGEGGCVVDFGFILDKRNFKKADVKELVIKLRASGLPSTLTHYTCGTHCAAGHKIIDNDANYLELIYWDADSSALKQDYIRGNLKGMDGEWFIYSISGEDLYYDNIKQIRFDPFGDYMPHGVTLDVDYIRFYGEPIPDTVPLKWSADFATGENGISLNAWKKADGSYMYDDGVNGDKGPGIGSKYIGNADDYITWNEEGYVTINAVANDEVKAIAAEAGKTAAVYDASAYVASLDCDSYIPAGSFEDVRIRMRLRDFPADGTALYGQNYGGHADATFNLATYPVYFHWMNNKDAVLYDGVQTKKIDDSVKFLEGSYTRDAWFTVSIPASFFEADVEDLATLRINLPDWMPDGAKVDIDYIKFYGKAPEATAPVTDNTVSLRGATETKENAIRFMASVTTETSDAASDIGWLVTTAAYMDTLDGVAYTDLDVTLEAGSNGKVKVAYNRVAGKDETKWFSGDDNYVVFAAALRNIPAKNAFDTIIVRPMVVAADEYFYGDILTTNLYKVAIKPYIDFTSEYYDSFEAMVEDGATYEDAFSYGDIAYNDAYNALSEAQQAYVDDVLKGLLG